MKIGNCVALSVVVCNLIAGQAYTNWNNTNFSDGDIVTINKDSNPPTVLTNQNITLASGTLLVNVDASAISNSICGIIACYNNGGSHAIGSTGSTINFTLSGTSNISNRGAFEIRGSNGVGPSLNFASKVSIDASGSNIEDVFQVADASLTLSGDVTIMTGKRAINAGNGKIGLGQGGKKVDITGDLKFTNKSDVKIKLNDGSKIQGDIAAESSTNIKIEMLQGSTIVGKFDGSGGTDFDLESQGGIFTGNITNAGGETKINLQNQGKINGGITASGTSFKTTLTNGSIGGDVTSAAVTNTVQMNGNSRIGRVVLGGTLNQIEVQGMENHMVSIGVNNRNSNNTIYSKDSGMLTVGSLDIVGTNNTIRRDPTDTIDGMGIGLLVIGNAKLEAATKNHVIFKSGGVRGEFLLIGETKLEANNEETIIGSIKHQRGKFDAQIWNGAQIQNGIETSGNGNSNLANTDNNVSLKDTSQINGNITFAGTTNEFEAQDSSVVSGGIHTEGQTTIGFKESAIIKNGTSDFMAKTEVLFANNAKAMNENFNIFQDSTIAFQDNSQMIGGSISNHGGIAGITFKNSTKMEGGIINAISGQTTFLAQDQANLSGSITQSGGQLDVDFKDSATFTGNITQNGDRQTISDIKVDNNSKMTGNIVLRHGTTDINFTGTSQIVGNIEVSGVNNTITFTPNTLLDGNLQYDSLAGSLGGGKSTVFFTGSKITGHIQGYNESGVTLKQTQVGQYFKQSSGHLKVTMIESLISRGFRGEGNSHNEMQMTQSKIENGITQNTGKLDLIMQNSIVAGGFRGTNSENTIQTTKGSIGDGIKQSGGTLIMTNNDTNITGGFEGTNQSINKATMANGGLNGGIIQNTGKLDFQSFGTNIAQGFLGQDSVNTLKMAMGNFSNGDIIQTRGSLKSEIISMQTINDFRGTDSENIVHLLQTEINNVTQSGGRLELQTNSTIRGDVKGISGSQNKISIFGANIQGDVTQETGSMELNLANASVVEYHGIKVTNAIFDLIANSSSVKSHITLENSTSTGIADQFVLEGGFKQTGGNSNFTFSNTKFLKLAKFQNAQGGLIFTKSTIQNVEAQGGLVNFSLSESQMTSFKGTGGTHSFDYVNSTTTDLSQSGGMLAIGASSLSKINSVSGANNSTLSISLDRSQIIRDVSNNGNTTLLMQDSEIRGNVEQNGNTMNFASNNSSLRGKYNQNNGSATFNFTKAWIEGGAEMTNLVSGSLNFNQNSKIAKGLQSSNSFFSFNLSNNSSFAGNATTKGLQQERGHIIGTLNGGSKIENGLRFSNGKTELSLYSKSSITGGIQATNNTTIILIDNSSIEGDITANDGVLLDLTAQNNSKITSNQMQVGDTDLKLTLDTNSQFIGNLTQINNKQDVVIKQESNFGGNITNIDTIGTLFVNNATLEGSFSQTDGKLAMDLSNEGKITKDVTLANVETLISGSGRENEIGGNFTQNNGSLNGAMNGLTLKGKYSQTGGTSEVSFTNSAFLGDTNISNAISSSLTFITSTLKNVTISGGDNNILKLLDRTEMTGNLTLNNGAKALLKMDGSTIEGNVSGTGDSILDLDTLNSTIAGNIDFNTGGIKGEANNTKIEGNITLTNTQSEINFTNQSWIGGNLTATDGSNTINFNASQIKGNVNANGGAINLDLSNGSKVGGNITFTDTKAHLTGRPAENEIIGSFITQGITNQSISSLTGDISSLTLHGTFTQKFGTSDISFRDQSLFKGQVSLNNANFAHLRFLNQSGIQNQIQIDGGKNTIDLERESFIRGGITTNNQSDTTITAREQSSIIGDINAINANQTIISLQSSRMDGNVNQNGGNFILSATQSQINSSIQENLFGASFANVGAQINLDQSVYSSSFKASDSILNFTLNTSWINSLQTPQIVNLENSSLGIRSSASNIGFNLTQSSNDGTHTLNFELSNSSVYSGSIDLNKIQATMLFDDSRLISPRIEITQGNLNLAFENAKHDIHREDNPEVVQNFIAQRGSKVDIFARNQSHAQIIKAEFRESTLLLQASESSRLEGEYFELSGGSNANYKASNNGNLNINTKIEDNASNLSIELNGGILQGFIAQDNFRAGDVQLASDGEKGGRWIVTEDSSVRNLNIANRAEQLESQDLFASSFDNSISLVDFTMNFEDHQESSRLGKEIVRKPPLQEGAIPPPLANQTYMRVLNLAQLQGAHGLFRVYADLGAGLADQIVANEASGDHLIQVQYRSDTFTEGGRGDRIVVARVEDPNASVNFKGTQSEVGLRKYDTEIIKENAQNGQGFEWIIGQVTPSGLSHSSKIIASILQSQYRMFALEADSLDRRLGGLDRITRDKGVWVRSFIGQASKNATSYSVGATDKYYSIWGGADYNSLGLTGHNFAGVFFNYTGVNTESKDYVGNTSNFALGFYNVFKANSGFYFDILAKYIYTTSTFAISNYSLARNKPKINNHKLLANFEMGYTFYIGEKRKSLYIQPQFQITGGYIQGLDISFRDIGGEIIRASIGHNAPAMMRLGAFVGRTFGEKIQVDLKAGTSLAYDVNSGGELNFCDSSHVFKTAQGGDFRMLLSAYADFKFADNFRMYTAFDTSFFGSYSTVFNVNLGLRFIFGRRNNIVSEVPMVYNPYEPTPPPMDRRTVPVVQDYTVRDIDTNYMGKSREVPSYQRNNNAGPVSGYMAQPMMRKNYRDGAKILNSNNPYSGDN